MKFISEIVKGGVNVEANGWYGKQIKKGPASKIKKVYMRLKSMARREMPEKVKYFNSGNCPDSGAERTAWLAEIDDFVPRLADLMITDFLRRKLIMNGTLVDPVSIATAKKNQTVGVSALGGLIETLKKDGKNPDL